MTLEEVKQDFQEEVEQDTQTQNAKEENTKQTKMRTDNIYYLLIMCAFLFSILIPIMESTKVLDEDNVSHVTLRYKGPEDFITVTDIEDNTYNFKLEEARDLDNKHVMILSSKGYAHKFKSQEGTLTKSVIKYFKTGGELTHHRDISIIEYFTDGLVDLLYDEETTDTTDTK